MEEDRLTITRLKRHASLFGIAIGLIVLAYAVAVAANATGFTLPNQAVSGKIFVGLIAMCLSLPLVGIALLFMTRPRLRHAWRKADNPNRVGLVAYLAIEAAGAVATWIAFIYVTIHS
jgi:hypothetical protein